MLHDLHQITCVTYNYLLLLFKKKGSTSFGCNARKFVLLYVNAWKCMLMLDWVSWSQPSSCAKVISESLARRVFVAQSQQADCLMSRRRGGHCHESSTVCLPPGNDHASESPSECCLECSESIPRRCKIPCLRLGCRAGSTGPGPWLVRADDDSDLHVCAVTSTVRTGNRETKSLLPPLIEVVSPGDIELSHTLHRLHWKWSWACGLSLNFATKYLCSV